MAPADSNRLEYVREKIRESIFSSLALVAEQRNRYLKRSMGYILMDFAVLLSYDVAVVVLPKDSDMRSINPMLWPIILYDGVTFSALFIACVVIAAVVFATLWVLPYTNQLRFLATFFITWLGFLMCSVLHWVFLTALTTPFACFQTHHQSLGESYPECFSQSHLSDLLLSVSMLPAFVFCNYFLLIGWIGTSPKDLSPLRSVTYSYEIYALCSRLVIAFLFIVCLPDNGTLFSALMLVLSLHRVKWLDRHMPHQELRVNNLRQALNATLVLSTMLALIMSILEDTSDTGEVDGNIRVSLFLLLLFNFPVVMWAGWHICVRKYELLVKGFPFPEWNMVQDSAAWQSAPITNWIQAHTETETDLLCRVMYTGDTSGERESVSFPISLSIENYKVYRTRVAKHLYQSYVATFPARSRIALAQALFESDATADEDNARIHLQRVKFLPWSMLMATVISVKLRALASTEGDYDTLETQVAKERAIDECKHLYLVGLQVIAQFWGALARNDLTSLIDAIKKMSNDIPAALQVYRTHLRNYPAEPEFYLLYSKYMGHIRNEPGVAEQAKRLADECSAKKLVEGEEGGAIITSDERGTIQSCSGHTLEMFGYAPKKLIGKNVNLLMGAPHRDNHSSYMKNYLNTGVTKVIGEPRAVVALHANGSDVPVMIDLKRLDVKGEVLFTARLELNQSSNEGSGGGYEEDIHLNIDQGMDTLSDTEKTITTSVLIERLRQDSARLRSNMETTDESVERMIEDKQSFELRRTISQISQQSQALASSPEMSLDFESSFDENMESNLLLSQELAQEGTEEEKEEVNVVKHKKKRRSKATDEEAKKAVSERLARSSVLMVAVIIILSTALVAISLVFNGRVSSEIETGIQLSELLMGGQAAARDLRTLETMAVEAKKNEREFIETQLSVYENADMMQVGTFHVYRHAPSLVMDQDVIQYNFGIGDSFAEEVATLFDVATKFSYAVRAMSLATEDEWVGSWIRDVKARYILENTRREFLLKAEERMETVQERVSDARTWSLITASIGYGTAIIILGFAAVSVLWRGISIVEKDKMSVVNLFFIIPTDIATRTEVEKLKHRDRAAEEDDIEIETEDYRDEDSGPEVEDSEFGHETSQEDAEIAWWETVNQNRTSFQVLRNKLSSWKKKRQQKSEMERRRARAKRTGIGKWNAQRETLMAQVKREKGPDKDANAENFQGDDEAIPIRQQLQTRAGRKLLLSASSTIRRMKRRYSIALLAISIVFTIIYALSVKNADSLRDANENLLTSSLVKYNVERTLFFFRETYLAQTGLNATHSLTLLNSLNASHIHFESLAAARARLDRDYNDLTYGGGDKSLKGVVGAQPYHDHLFSSYCVFEGTENEAVLCGEGTSSSVLRGLHVLIMELLDIAAAVGQPRYDWNSSTIDFSWWWGVFGAHIRTSAYKFWEFFFIHFDETRSAGRIDIIVCSAVLGATLVGVWVTVFRPMIAEVETESQLSALLLRMVPDDIIDNHPEIAAVIEKLHQGR